MHVVCSIAMHHFVTYIIIAIIFGTDVVVSMTQGLGNTTMFCGDGINDLAALSAANIGMSIAGADAVIAAELCTSQGSVAGWHCIIRHFH